MQTEKFIRRPFEVNVVQVTPQNCTEIAQWCGGEVTTANYKLAGFVTKMDAVKVPGNGPNKDMMITARIGSYVVEHEGKFRVFRKKQFVEMFSNTHNVLHEQLKPGDLVQDKDESDGERQGTVKYVNQVLVDYGMLGNVLHDPSELVRIDEFSSQTKSRLAQEYERQKYDANNEALRAAAEKVVRQAESIVSIDDLENVGNFRVGGTVRVVDEMNQFFSQTGVIDSFVNENTVAVKMNIPNCVTEIVHHLLRELEIEEHTEWGRVRNPNSPQFGWVGWVVRDRVCDEGDLVRLAFRPSSYLSGTNDRCFSYMPEEVEAVSHDQLEGFTLVYDI